MGNRIKELRKKSKLSQAQLAKKMNTTQANISSWEKNKWQPDNDALIKLSNIFECSIDYLLCKSNNLIDTYKAQPAPVEEKEELTDKQKELLSLIKNMDNDDINKIIGYAFSLSEKALTTEEKIEKLLKLKN